MTRVGPEQRSAFGKGIIVFGVLFGVRFRTCSAFCSALVGVQRLGVVVFVFMFGLLVHVQFVVRVIFT